MSEVILSKNEVPPDLLELFEPIHPVNSSILPINTSQFRGDHFATYPEALAETPIKAGSRRGDIVLDPFSGTATTACVAKRLGRKYLGIELNKAYVELGNRRLAKVVPDHVDILSKQADGNLLSELY